MNHTGRASVTTERTRADAALAFIASQIRPDWDQAGILAAIRKCSHRPLDQLAAGVLYAAKVRRDQRTPAFIASDGEHWSALDKMTGKIAAITTQPPGSDMCPWHRQAHPCPTCRDYKPADRETAARIIAEAKAGIRPTTTGDPEIVAQIRAVTQGGRCTTHPQTPVKIPSSPEQAGRAPEVGPGLASGLESKNDRKDTKP